MLVVCLVGFIWLRNRSRLTFSLQEHVIDSQNETRENPVNGVERLLVGISHFALWIYPTLSPSHLYLILLKTPLPFLSTKRRLHCNLGHIFETFKHEDILFHKSIISVFRSLFFLCVTMTFFREP